MTDSNNEFGTLNLTTGVFTLINTTPQNIFGMGFAPNGTLYGTGFTNSTTPPNVYTINPATGAAVNLGASSNYSALGSTVGSDGLIYAVSQNASSSVFYTINTSTLATNTINGALGFPADGLAAFDNGQFYTDELPGTSDVLEQIDPTTGAPTAVGTGLGFGAFAGTLVGTTLYAVGIDTSSAPVLETINTTTGVGTFVADITGMLSGSQPDALAYSPVPEPW